MNVAIELHPNGYFMISPKVLGLTEVQLMQILNLRKRAPLVLIVDEARCNEVLIDALYDAVESLDDALPGGHC